MAFAVRDGTSDLAARDKKVMAVLLILSGKHQGKRLALPEGEVIIGRDAICQIRLATEEVSRQHCRLRCEDGEVFVTDLASRNGTFIEDHGITTETPLHPGETLRVGPVSFQLVGKKGAEQWPGKKPSDDSIMDWLADGGSSRVGDSTVIRQDSVTASKPVPPPQTSPVETPPLTPLPMSKKLKTIGEEGEAIIQRHYDLVQAGKIPKRCSALRKP